MARNLLLSSAHPQWPEEIWLDTGLLYPFFQKDRPTNVMCWIDELISLARTKKIFLTAQVRDEVKAVYKFWKPKERSELSKKYQKLFSLVRVTPQDAEELHPLSAADVSLTKRSSGTLFTADRRLFEFDRGPSARLKMHQDPLGNVSLEMEYKPASNRKGEE